MSSRNYVNARVIYILAERLQIWKVQNFICIGIYLINYMILIDIPIFG
jgi:hypothetical protein